MIFRVDVYELRSKRMIRRISRKAARVITEEVRFLFNNHHIESNQNHVFNSKVVCDVQYLKPAVRAVMN